MSEDVSALRARLEQLRQEMSLRIGCEVISSGRSDHACPNNTNGYGDFWCNGCLIRTWVDGLTALLDVTREERPTEKKKDLSRIDSTRDVSTPDATAGKD